MCCRFFLPIVLLSFAAPVFSCVCAADDKPSVDEQRVAELTASIKSQPGDPSNYRLRAFEYALGRKWAKAAADFVQVAKLQVGYSMLEQQLGVFLVLAGDRKTHATLCMEMLQTFGNSGDAAQLERTAKVCALAPELVGEPEEVLEIARRCVELAADRAYVSHHHRTLALVLYRMKRYDDAIAAVHAADQADAASSLKLPNVIVTNRAIEAMCLFRKGNTGQAQRVLAQGTPTLNAAFKNEALHYTGGAWHDWLIAKALHDEAQQLLEK